MAGRCKRKEMHVKDLETKLASLEAAQQQVLVENGHLEQNLHRVSTENEILRAPSQISEDLYSLEPATFNAAKFYANFLPNQNAKNPPRFIITRDRERLLDAGTAWDFIINHRLLKKGPVDIGYVSERLKHCARYDNHRVVLPERSIIAAIDQSVASRADDLL
ncbi:AP-1-like transcription factor [Fusarium falciforme]